MCAVGTSADTILDTHSIPTTEPETTLGACVDWLRLAQDRFGTIAAVGLACFGPLCFHRGSNDFGRILSTPKPLWSGADLLQPFRERLNVPLMLDTDVAAAALAEWRRVASDIRSLAYVTVGTGIGGGVAPRSNRGELLHPEMGHLPVRRDARDSDFNGVCPFHGDCLEGLASGPSIRARWGCDLGALPPEHKAWSIIGGYLGQLAAAIALMISAERIVFGGGVATHHSLLPHIRSAARDTLNGYLAPLKDESFEHYIAPASLGSGAGISGAMLLAEQALGLKEELT